MIMLLSIRTAKALPGGAHGLLLLLRNIVSKPREHQPSYRGVLVRVAKYANNLDIFWVFSQIWIVCIRLYVVAVKVFYAAATLAATNRPYSHLNDPSHAMRPLGDAALPFWVFVALNCGSACAKSRAVSSWPTIPLATGKNNSARKTAIFGDGWLYPWFYKDSAFWGARCCGTPKVSIVTRKASAAVTKKGRYPTPSNPALLRSISHLAGA